MCFFISSYTHHIYLHGQLSITKHFCGYGFKATTIIANYFLSRCTMHQILVQFSDTPLRDWTQETAFVIWKFKMSWNHKRLHSFNGKYIPNAYWVLDTVLGSGDTLFIRTKLLPLQDSLCTEIKHKYSPDISHSKSISIKNNTRKSRYRRNVKKACILGSKNEERG